jgi:hypothetical protein
MDKFLRGILPQLLPALMKKWTDEDQRVFAELCRRLETDRVTLLTEQLHVILAHALIDVNSCSAILHTLVKLVSPPGEILTVPTLLKNCLPRLIIELIMRLGTGSQKQALSMLRWVAEKV